MPCSPEIDASSPEASFASPPLTFPSPPLTDANKLAVFLSPPTYRRACAEGFVELAATGDVAQHEGWIDGLWPTAVAQGRVAGAQVAGRAEVIYQREPPAAVLKGVGLHTLSVGEILGHPNDQTLVQRETDGPISYRKLVARDGFLVGALLVGHAREASTLTDAVRTHMPIESADELAPAAGLAP